MAGNPEFKSAPSLASFHLRRTGQVSWLSPFLICVLAQRWGDGVMRHALQSC